MWLAVLILLSCHLSRVGLLSVRVLKWWEEEEEAEARSQQCSLFWLAFGFVKCSLCFLGYLFQYQKVIGNGGNMELSAQITDEQVGGDVDTVSIEKLQMESKEVWAPRHC